MEKLDDAISGRKEIDAEVLDELEFALITADIGASTTAEILERIRQQVERSSARRRGAVENCDQGTSSRSSRSCRKGLFLWLRNLPR